MSGSLSGTRLGFNRQALIRRAGLVILCGIALHLTVSLIVTDLDEVRSLVDFTPGYLLLAVVLVLFPWLTNSLRLWNWLRFLGRRERYGRALRIVVFAELGAAVSPSAVGGAPVKAALLMERGLPAGQAISLTSLGSLEDVCFGLIFVPFGFVLMRLWELPVFQTVPMEIARRVGISALVLLIGGFALWGVSRRFRHLGRVQRIASRLRGIWDDFRELYRFVGQRGRSQFLINVGLSTLQWSARYSVLTALAAGLGLEVDPIRLALLQWFCFALMSVIPTPGATGGAEAAFVLLYAGMVPSGMLAVLTVGWRFLTYYFLSLMAVTIIGIGSLREKWSGARARSRTPLPPQPEQMQSPCRQVKARKPESRPCGSPGPPTPAGSTPGVDPAT